MPYELIQPLVIVNLTLLGVMMNEILTRNQPLLDTTPHLDRWMLKRSAAVHAMRIEEARAYLDILVAAFQQLTGAARTAKQPKRSHLKTYSWYEALRLLDIARTQRYRVYLFDDPVLNSLDERLDRVVADERDIILERSTMSAQAQELNEDEAARISEAYQRGLALIHEMQRRLDALAHIAF